MKINLGRVDAFEKRFIKSMAYAGATELALGLSPFGHWLGEHLLTFGYLGVGLIILATYHTIFKRREEQHDQ